MFLIFVGTLSAQKYNLLQDTLRLCAGDSVTIELMQQLDKNSSVYWTTPDEIITNTKKIKALKQGKYGVKVSSSLFPAALYDSTYVCVYSKPKFNLRDTVICKGKSLVLDAKNVGLRYFWNTYETTQKIKIESPGRYWVKLTNGGCTAVDSLTVRLVQNSGAFVNPEALFCLNEDNKIINVKASAGTKILWNTGATTPSIAVSKEGDYWVKTSNNNCGERIDTIRVKLKVCDCEMMIPNSFTPNEDNRNDYFFPVLQCDYSYFTLTITDRWGNTVFSSNSVNAKWDGRYKGNLCPEDIYVFKIESTEKGNDKKLIRNGRISLFR